MSEQINRVLADRPQSFTTAEQLQARINIGAQASGDYAFNSALSAKLDASASSLFQPSGNYQTAGDYAYNSALSAKLDATASSMFQPSGDYAYSSALSAKQDVTGMSAYVPYSAIECDTASSVTSIGGSAVGAGSFSGFEHDSNLSGSGTTAVPLGLASSITLGSSNDPLTGTSWLNITPSAVLLERSSVPGPDIGESILTCSSLRLYASVPFQMSAHATHMASASVITAKPANEKAASAVYGHSGVTVSGGSWLAGSAQVFTSRYGVSGATFSSTDHGTAIPYNNEVGGAGMTARDTERTANYRASGINLYGGSSTALSARSATECTFRSVSVQEPSASAAMSPNGLTAYNSAGYTGYFCPSATEIRCYYGLTSVATGRLLHNGVEFYVVLPGEVPNEHCYFSPAGIHGCGSFGDYMYTDSWVSARRYEGTADSGNSMTVDIGHATTGGVVRFPSITMGVPSASSTIHMSSISSWNNKLDMVDVGYGLEGEGKNYPLTVTGASGRWDGMHNRYTMDLSADGLRVVNYDLDYSATRKQIAVGNGGVRLSACDTAGSVSSLVRLEEGVVAVTAVGSGSTYVESTGITISDTAYNTSQLSLSSLKALSAMYDWCTSQGMTPIV